MQFKRLLLTFCLGSSFLGFGLASMGALAQPAYAANILVTCGPGNVGNPSTLIAAIESANTDPGPDTVILAGGCVFTLTAVNNVTLGPTGLPLITSTMTISGNGATIARDQSAPHFRLFAVDTAGALTLQSLTLRGGQVKGADGQFGSGAAPGQGGALYNRGIAALDKTTLLSNTALGGNTSDGGGAGAGQGGAIFSITGTLTLSNSTVSANSAVGGTNGFGGNGSGLGGAIYNYNGTVVLDNSTLAGNTANEGGALFNKEDSGTASLELSNTILADSFSASHDCYNSGSTDLSGSHNLVENDAGGGNSCSSVGITQTGDPKLGPLGDYGGDTPTQPLLLGSPAKDSGDNGTCPTTDQRGFMRPQGLTCDIGAFEVTPQEIEVRGNDVVINDGDDSPSLDDGTNFGTTSPTAPVDQVFSIHNGGDEALNLTGFPKVLLTGGGGAFSVIDPPDSSIPAYETSTFTLRFDPASTGVFVANVIIVSNDADENPFDFEIRGSSSAVTFLPIVLR